MLNPDHNPRDNDPNTGVTCIRDMEKDTYDLDLRAEEIANTNVEDYGAEATDKLKAKYDKDYALPFEMYDSLYERDNDINEDRLKIFVTYKITITNQSGICGAVTEIVDYFDKNYEFVEAWEADINGNNRKEVSWSDNSRLDSHGRDTEFKNNDKYKTKYIQPNRDILGNGETQYIFVKLQVLGENDYDAGNFLKKTLLDTTKEESQRKVSLINLAEINGYATFNDKSGNGTPGLIDSDSNPGNFDIRGINEFNQENLEKYSSVYEDDTSKAPTMIYQLLQSRSIEGTVFEDSTGLDSNVNSGKERKGDRTLDSADTPVKDVRVQLVEIKNDVMYIRAETRTNAEGWYGFTGFVPGDYTIRYIYGSDDLTAMTTESKWIKGSNAKSYNGKDFQATTYADTIGGVSTSQTYVTDGWMLDFLQNKGNQPSIGETVIKKYNLNSDGSEFYWFANDVASRYSDAEDDMARRNEIHLYSSSQYDLQINNYKAEVFNSYFNAAMQPKYMTEAYNRQLATELENETFEFAYTPEISIEVESARKTSKGNGKNKDNDYRYKIENVDFGLVEKPKAKMELTKNVSHVKVTTAEGTVVIDGGVQDVNKENIQWMTKGNRYSDRIDSFVYIIMDNEILNGAVLDITYTFTVTNNVRVVNLYITSEIGVDNNVRVVNLLDYVDNELNFNPSKNSGWEVVKLNDVKKADKRDGYDGRSTLVNFKADNEEYEKVDLSRTQTIIKATSGNTLLNNLAPGGSVSFDLVLDKTLTPDSAMEFDNIAEIAEISESAGGYDHSAVPGNQRPEDVEKETDSYRAERVLINPPTGSASLVIYYIVGIGALVVLGVGIFLIKKFVVKK